MEFQLFHNKYFNAVDGSYSVVTPREEYDSQITLTDAEADMVFNYFGVSNIQIGNVGSNRMKAKKTFFLYPSFTPIELNLVFPKPEKHELRLYISSRAGFKPKSGQIWFLYIDSNARLVIGALDESLWNGLDQIDTYDENYLQEIQNEIKAKGKIIESPKGKIIKVNIAGKVIYGRNPLIAVASLTRASFKCEVNPSHKTFIAEKTKDPYVEAHHFVPMKFQDSFSFPLDCTENIISLCPTCHRGIHLGVIEHKKTLISALYKSKKAINNFSLNDLFSFYNFLRP